MVTQSSLSRRLQSRLNNLLRRFTEHDAVHAVEESVRHVGGFGSRWSGGFDHGLEHLSGCDHRFAREVALVDHHLLSQEDLLYGYLHPKIAASDHERVRFAQDLVKVQHSCLVLNLSMIQTSVFKTRPKIELEFI